MRYSISTEVNQPPAPNPSTSGCNLYVATHKETGKSLIILDTYMNIIFFEDDGYISHSTKEYLHDRYTVRAFTAEDNLTVEGIN